MQIKAYATSWRAAPFLAAGALVAAIMVNGDAAQATGDGSYAISGNSTFSDCGVDGSDFALLMTGDLQGCLSIFVQSYTCKQRNGFDHYIERGREKFVGKWRGKYGKFITDYTINAAYADGFCESFDFTLELSGSCFHKIQGRTGVFEGAEGAFTMFDVITNVTGDPVTGTFAAGSGANNFLYSGRIRFGDAIESAAFEDTDLAEPRSSLAATLATRKARSGRSC